MFQRKDNSLKLTIFPVLKDWQNVFVLIKIIRKIIIRLEQPESLIKLNQKSLNNNSTK